MTIHVKTGWEKHGAPAGKRGFREPKKISELDFLNLLSLFTFVIVAALYGIILNILELLRKKLWAKPIDLKGKICFVTGSGRGLGRQICLDLAKRGAKIACADINEETNKITLKELEDMGATAKAYKLNVANRQEVVDCVEKIEKDLGPIFVAVNNAAILLPPAEYTEEFVRASFNVNTLGPIWVTQALLPKMMSRDNGNIVNIASITSFYPLPESDVYSATKAALRSYTNSINMRLKEKDSKVKAICINPTTINTSADYSEMLFFSKAKPVSVERVSRAVVTAVRYGIEDVTIPAIAKCGILFQFIPTKAVNLFMGLTSANIVIPTMEEYEDLPAGDLVKACWSAGDAESKMNGTAFERSL